jgi:hypothetical protein
MISSNRIQIGTSFDYTITPPFPRSAFFFEELDHCTNFQSLACKQLTLHNYYLSLFFSRDLLDYGSPEYGGFCYFES